MSVAVIWLTIQFYLFFAARLVDMIKLLYTGEVEAAMAFYNNTTLAFLYQHNMKT